MLVFLNREVQPCPDETTVLDFVQGLLPPASAREMEEHVDRCVLCRKLLSELARWSLPSQDAKRSPPDAVGSAGPG